MSEQGNRQEGVAGDTDHPQHRAGPGEGRRAPFVADGGEAAEMSVFDGAGNESVVRLSSAAEGRTARGTGPRTCLRRPAGPWATPSAPSTSRP